VLACLSQQPRVRPARWRHLARPEAPLRLGLAAAGESVVAVAERLGHENATLVLKTYGHLMPDCEDRTRRAIDTA
jgi:integrase